MSPQTVYDLGRDWYASRLDLDFEPLTPAQAQAIFAKHGLVAEF
ncbi:MAG: hypothetical protein NTY02_12955 [Acidobacteria bacterium]|nr:hypothetical protein [Acidobacteriota bacterium]